MPLNHVTLTVTNQERSAGFYAEHFGLTQRAHDDEYLLILRAPDGSLLALTEGMPPRDLPGTNHFGFQLTSCGEVRAARARLRDAGGSAVVPRDEFSRLGRS
jgi:catechol 2,3-dioxygenase-like lactoylglutathione lyase family enzyme